MDPGFTSAATWTSDVICELCPTICIMLRFFDEWLARKHSRRLCSIREGRTVTVKHARQLGPRGEFAVVQLRGDPADEFKFDSHAAWPTAQMNHTTAVLDGILDELFATGLGRVPANIHFTLMAIEWHDVDSCANAFYHAARQAVREILGLETYNYNIALT